MIFLCDGSKFLKNVPVNHILKKKMMCSRVDEQLNWFDRTYRTVRCPRPARRTRINVVVFVHWINASSSWRWSCALRCSRMTMEIFSWFSRRASRIFTGSWKMKIRGLGFKCECRVHSHLKGECRIHSNLIYECRIPSNLNLRVSNTF